MTVMFCIAHNPAGSHKVKKKMKLLVNTSGKCHIKFWDFIIMTSVLQYFIEFSIMSIDH